MKPKEETVVPTLKELLKMKEKCVNPLSYNFDFSRLTQLFQRPLQIKYYEKKPPKNAQQRSADGQREAPKYMTEDGEILEGNFGQEDNQEMDPQEADQLNG